MASFLIALDNKGQIEEVKWTTNPEIISEKLSFPSLLDKKKKEEITSFVSKDSKGAEHKSFTLHLRTNKDILQVSLHVIRMNNTVLALGISDQGAQDPGIQELIKAYNDIFNHLRTEIKKSTQTNEEMQKQFEQLQKMNNELNNTRRKIEKSNYRLENLNRDLQARLLRDPLTGLIGRYQFWVGIKNMIDTNPDKKGIFIFMDIDDFKQINDTFGHVGGDHFLVEIGERIKKIPLENSMKIRISGDEFGIFVNQIENIYTDHFQRLWNLIEEYILKEPVYFNKIAIPISLSAGMTVYGIDTFEVEELLEYADFAMYQAKRKGKNRFARFDKRAFEKQRQLKQQREEVKKVLEEKDLYHVYQPVFSTSDGQIMGFSALMRSENAYFTSTNDLIENALRENLYQELDHLSYNKLMAEKDLLKKIRDRILYISLGPFSMAKSKDNTPKNPLGKNLALEIVQAQMAPPGLIRSILQDTERTEFQVGIGNFGAGDFDDLEILTFNPDFLKISRELTQNIPEDRAKQDKIKKIVTYAHQQKTKVIMDGIETQKEFETAMSLNVDYLQGFYLGKPASELYFSDKKKTEEILKTRQKR